ncbi:unnamed protein product [Arctia plantaginis]|uniref:Uncharacterized protein n=1 Tax=Arctia plantaginis TaxID=874455 RepID=A0A8S1A603_ARCPL|nr:unnamed protein product [Arctia plantaginis]
MMSTTTFLWCLIILESVHLSISEDRNDKKADVHVLGEPTLGTPMSFEDFTVRRDSSKGSFYHIMHLLQHTNSDTSEHHQPPNYTRGTLKAIIAIFET